MYTPPTQFTDWLENEFHGRFRIRWSVASQSWQLEYKVGPSKVHSVHAKSNDDQAIRARDGYAFGMAIQPGDRMACPRCGYELHVPVYKFGEVNCDYCKMIGNHPRVAASYFPLDGMKIREELIKLDPLRAYRNGLHLAADAANARKVKDMERKFTNQVEDITLHNFNKTFNIQSVGYTGKTFTGN